MPAPAQPSPVVMRFALQAGARELLRGVQLEGVSRQKWSGEWREVREHRTCHCLRRLVDPEQGVGVYHLPKHSGARFDNLQTCASVWACPVCSARITEYRRKEVRSAVDAARSQGLKVVMFTRTVPHDFVESVSKVLELLKRAVNYACGGRKYRDARERFGVVGSIRATEVTRGVNGWHVHMHELAFLEPGYDLAELRAEFAGAWSNAVQLAGGRQVHAVHGFDAVDCDARIADYVAKWNREPEWQEDRELTKAPSKRGKVAGHFTPLELLAQFTFEGNAVAGGRWVEYVQAFHGRHQLQWSRGLWVKLFGKTRKQMRDEQIVSEKLDDGAVKMATIPLEEWRVILRAEERGRVLEAASTGDLAALMAVLERISAEWGGGRIAPELAAQEREQHGWRVAAKTRRDASDRAVLWQTDRLLETMTLFGLDRGDREARQQAKGMLIHADRVRRETRTRCVFTRRLLRRKF